MNWESVDQLECGEVEVKSLDSRHMQAANTNTNTNTCTSRASMYKHKWGKAYFSTHVGKCTQLLRSYFEPFQRGKKCPLKAQTGHCRGWNVSRQRQGQHLHKQKHFSLFCHLATLMFHYTLHNAQLQMHLLSKVLNLE